MLTDKIKQMQEEAVNTFGYSPKQNTLITQTAVQTLEAVVEMAKGMTAKWKPGDGSHETYMRESYNKALGHLITSLQAEVEKLSGKTDV